VVLNGKQSTLPLHGTRELIKRYRNCNQAAIGFEIEGGNMFNYPVTLKKDGDTILATFRDVPEAITFGADKDEALLMPSMLRNWTLFLCRFSLDLAFTLVKLNGETHGIPERTRVRKIRL
jgi:hypothetical protein